MRRRAPLLLSFLTLFFCVLPLVSQEESLNRERGEGIFAIVRTPRGEIEFELFYKVAPIGVANFLQLTEGGSSFSGYYQNRRIEVLEDYAIQLGGTDKEESVGLGFTLPLETSQEPYFDQPYVLFADRLASNSSASNLLISLKSDPQLNEKYSVLGRVVHGSEVVKKLRDGVKITEISILRSGDEALNFSLDVDEAKRKFFEREYPQVAAFLKTWGEYTTLKNGLFVKKITESAESGESDEPRKSGDRISIHYIGKLLGGGEFDNSYLRGQPLLLIAGRDDRNLIPGFRQTLEIMRPGDHWEVLIPPNLGYGGQELSQIPANSWLVFEIEMLPLDEG